MNKLSLATGRVFQDIQGVKSSTSHLSNPSEGGGGDECPFLASWKFTVFSNNYYDYYYFNVFIIVSRERGIYKQENLDGGEYRTLLTIGSNHSHHSLGGKGHFQ